MNAFTFIPRKSHENLPNKLMVTTFIRGTLPMFNNKAILDFIDKLPGRIDKKTRNTKKQRAFQQGVQNESFSLTGKTQKL